MPHAEWPQGGRVGQECGGPVPARGECRVATRSWKEWRAMPPRSAASQPLIAEYRE